jgi:hypothetical protein
VISDRAHNPIQRFYLQQREYLRNNDNDAKVGVKVRLTSKKYKPMGPQKLDNCFLGLFLIEKKPTNMTLQLNLGDISSKKKVNFYLYQLKRMSNCITITSKKGTALSFV